MKMALLVPRPRDHAAFTMIEIAIALAVIAFALVAIIGVLPTGLNVQKDNLADTIINQDGAYFMEAIKSGSQGLDELTNSVEEISIYDGTTLLQSQGDFRTGMEIIGHLSYFGGKDIVTTTAIVRALSGGAAEKGSDKDTRDLAFKYQLKVQIVSFLNNHDDLYRTEDVRRALQQKLYEITLDFRWPILANGEPGNGHRIFRSLVAADLLVKNVGGRDLFFFQP